MNKNVLEEKGKSSLQYKGERRPRKKLSFKDPEAEIFHAAHESKSSTVPRYKTIGACESASILRSSLRLTSERLSSSLEDLELESQAMRIVRTIGQAFEVCHKLSLTHTTSTTGSQEDIPCEKSNEALCEASNKGKIETDRTSEPNSCDTQTEDINRGASIESTIQRPTKLESLAPPASESGLKTASELGETYTSPLSEPLPLLGALPPEGTPLSLYHQLQLLRHQLEQQSQQTQAAIAQVQLLKDQLSAETAARLEAQAQNHQLLVHNKELLDHIRMLVKQIQDLEKKQEGKIDTGMPELPSVCEAIQSLPGTVSSSNTWHLPEIIPTTARSTSLDNTLNISQGYESRAPKDIVSSSSLQNSTSQHRSSSSPSSSPRMAVLTDEKTNLFLSGLPFTSSPTRSNFARTTDDIFRLQRLDGSQSRTRSPTSSQPSEDSLSNLTSLQLADSNTTFSVPISTPPQLNPPPQKSRNTKISEPVFTSKQSKISMKSSGMDEIIGRSISYQETSQRPDVVSWPSSQLSINQLATSNVHTSLSRQSSQPAYQYSEKDSFSSQMARDIGRLNIQEKEQDYLRISESLFSQKDDSMQMLFKS